DLGVAPASSLRHAEPFARGALTTLKPGQYSPIITVATPSSKQVFGFRIVRLIAKEPAGQRELSDPRVQQGIRQQLRERREQLLKSAYYEDLRDNAKVQNYFAGDILRTNGNAK